MGLKVAHKVIIGFSIILLLLLFSSISSMGILSDIKAATAKVDNFALPIQKNANKVQKQLLIQAKSSALIATLNKTNAVDKLKKQFVQQEQVLHNNILLIEKLLAEFPQIKNLTTFKKAYALYQKAVIEMFAFRKADIKQMQALIVQQKALYNVLDEASAILGDLSFLEDSQHQQQIEQIVANAGKIEGLLFTITDGTKAIISLNSIDEVKKSQQAINFGLDDIEQNLVFLKRLGEDYNTDGLIDDFIQQFKQSKAMLKGDDNLFNVKINQLEQRNNLQSAFLNSEKNMANALSAIEVFLQAVDSNVEQLQTNVFENVDQGNIETIVILIVLFVIGAGIAFATIRSMLIPLRRINKVLSFIAKGDLSRQLTVTTNDEYGELSKSVNLVVADLRKLITHISDNTVLLNDAAEQSSNEIAQVSDALTEQKETIEQVSITTDELGQSADHILAKANNAETQMNSALEQGNELERTANITNERMQNLVTMLDDTTRVMTVLQQESANISGILDTIRSISDQTNLLALNAAIEAARAGEAGRGFAVVADEVRLLASRTQESATEIQQMIESLQKQTEQAANDISRGKNEANNCQDQTDQLITTLLLITQAIEQMHAMSGEISSSATQQNSLSANIEQRIHAVVALSQQTNDKSSSTLVYSKQVADLATTLNKAIGEFKI